MSHMNRSIEARVNGLVQDPLIGQTAIILKGKGQASLLPIWIGLPEALAISQVMLGRGSVRPMTHQLFLKTIQSLNGRLHSIEITRVENEVFFAALHVKTVTGTVMIDARPSDAIALALNAQVPITVAESVWKSSSVSFDALGIRQPEHTRKLRDTKILLTKLSQLRKEESRTR